MASASEVVRKSIDNLRKSVSSSDPREQELKEVLVSSNNNNRKMDKEGSKDNKRVEIEMHADNEGDELDVIKKLTLEQAFEQFITSSNGLSTEEVNLRHVEFGFNSLPEETKNPVLQFLLFLWNPLSWAMEAAAILSIVLSDYVDFGLIVGLLLFNAAIGFWEEHQAGNAIAALKANLAPNANAKRDGTWQSVPAVDLVPGDIIRLRIGEVIPADCKLLEGDSLKVDQSSLTGESLPVTKYAKDVVLSGSVIKQGEIEGMVFATGKNTFFGKAANLIAETEESGHFQAILTKIGGFCIIFIVLWVMIELIIQFGVRGKSCAGVAEGDCPTLTNILVLIVGGIPVAMPTVLSVTMAIGAYQLAAKEAIVSRLTAVEELAGMDILCSDKTGTLTLNKLTVDEPCPYAGHSPQSVIFDAALAANAETNEAIDVAIVNYCQEGDRLKQYQILHFLPFDPVGKRTQAKVKGPDGKIFFTTKGAPQVVLDLAINKDDIRDEVEKKILDFASKGYRSLGIGRCDSETPDSFVFTGIIPLFDPPRHDTKQTIEKAQAMGIRVKMITGDQLAIAKETARRLGMGQNMYGTSQLDKNVCKQNGITVGELIEKADGFAQVYPEHKFDIVKRLQKRKHVVGMTGDGVNDAPALKKADIGIAVANSTDAARAAADIVLLSPGLGVIIDAIIGSRKIFQRMKNYAIYSIACTIRICLTFGILTIAYDFYFPTLVIVILAVLNDGTIMTISKDQVKPSPIPDNWNLKEIFIMAFSLGGWLVISTIILYEIVVNTTALEDAFGLPSLNLNEVRGLVYLHVSISGQATIFITRSRTWFFVKRPAWIVLAAFVIAQTAATFIGVYGFNGYPDDGATDFEGCGWGYALFVWIWTLIWHFPMDLIKFVVLHFTAGYSLLELGRIGKKRPPPGAPVVLPRPSQESAGRTSTSTIPRPSLDRSRVSIERARASMDGKRPSLDRGGLPRTSLDRGGLPRISVDRKN